MICAKGKITYLSGYDGLFKTDGKFLPRYFHTAKQKWQIWFNELMFHLALYCIWLQMCTAQVRNNREKSPCSQDIWAAERY